jgi:hypothetical protein
MVEKMSQSELKLERERLGGREIYNESVKILRVCLTTFRIDV